MHADRKKRQLWNYESVQYKKGRAQDAGNRQAGLDGEGTESLFCSGLGARKNTDHQKGVPIFSGEKFHPGGGLV